MSNTKNQPSQEQKHHHQSQQKNQQQKTRQEHGPKKQGKNPSLPSVSSMHHDQEQPETRMTR